MRTSQIAPPPRLLMGPGPISADPRVLRAMSASLLGQFDPAMTALMTETQGHGCAERTRHRKDLSAS